MSALTLEDRVTALERQNRRLRRVAFGALGLLAVGVVMGQQAPRAPRVIEAQEFHALDAAGKIRVLLGTTDEKGAALTLHDAARKTRVLLTTTDEKGGPSLAGPLSLVR